MSHVTDIILMCSLAEETADGPGTTDGPTPAIEKLNAWLKESGRPPLVRLDSAAGGNKAFQGIFAAAAFNDLDIPEFRSAVASVEWESPDSVQIAIKDEHEETFSVYQLKDERPTPPVSLYAIADLRSELQTCEHELRGSAFDSYEVERFLGWLEGKS